MTILRQEVEREGCISLARFMELALYCPDFGYYERESVSIGRGGDFYTSVSTGPLFGALLGCQFAEWLAAVSSGPVQLIEAGAHDGQLALDILAWLRAHRPKFFEQLEYWVVEPSSRRQEWQRQKLEGFAGRVRWAASLQALPAGGVTGVIFSNELLDAFPVRRLAWDARAREWFEWGVGFSDGRFVWKRLPPAGADYRAQLKVAGFPLAAELEAVLPDGYVLELGTAARDWWAEAASVLRRGRLVAIDYGATAEELLVPARSGGTLRAYRDHQSVADVLADPGGQDLTAHVNFSDLIRAGEAEGLRTDDLVTQAQFLTRMAKDIWAGLPSPSPGDLRQLQTLTHPEHLGRSFRVLVQSRPG